MGIIEDIDKKAIQDFTSKCNEDLLKKMIENFKRESLLTSCTLFAERNQFFYRDNLYRTISININNLKQFSEKKLALVRCFYSLCKDKDILEMIHDNLYKIINHTFPLTT